MGYETIRLDLEGSVAVVRLSRPERMNAVTETMYRELIDVLDQTGRDADLRALVVTGSIRVKDGVSKQAFCAGADLKEHAAGRRSDAEQRAYIELAHEATRRLYRHPNPVVAAVNGPARGAGAEMAMACDLVLMAEEATLAFPETSLGTFVGGGVTWHLPRVVGLARAKELIYTGRVIDGREAVRLGLAVRAVPVDELEAEAMALARRLAGQAPLSMRLAKEQLQDAADHDLDAALRLEAEGILACMETDDWHEGASAFVERRAPRFRGR